MILRVIKLNRGEYNLVDEYNNQHFAYPVSKWDAEQMRQNIEVFERMLTHPGINKAVQKFVNTQRLNVSEYGDCEQIIRNYARELYHKDMREMMRRPKLFYGHLEKEHAKNKAAREARRLENE